MSEINGDGPLSAADRFRYIWRNIVRNARGRLVRYKTTPWHPDLQLLTRRHNEPVTPLRALSEAFVLDALPQHITQRRVSVLHVGCRSGRLLSALTDAGFSGRYCGLNIDGRFDRTRAKPEIFEIEVAQQDIHKFDLVVSNSAPEHIPDDARAIERLGSMLTPDGRQMQVFRLGGVASFLLHLSTITILEQICRLSLRRHFSRSYLTALRICLRTDHWLPFMPSGYVMLSNPQTPLTTDDSDQALTTNQMKNPC
jgi:SAM-dependent methyltransferase